MGWKKRRNGRTYYYRSIRTGSGVRTEYVGRGLLAEFCASIDTRWALRLELERTYWAEASARIKAREKDLNNWLRTVRHLVDGTLRLWGYHEHKREWRLVRRKGEIMVLSTQVKNGHATLERVIELLRAKKLTDAEKNELEMGLKNHPSVVNNVGDVGELLRQQLIATMTNLPGVMILWDAKLQAMRNEMGYAEAPSAERLVIDTVLTCWLHLQWTESGYQSFWQNGGTPGQIAIWENRLSSAQNRFARQVELLAKLRYWGSRVHQVNIAQNMIVSNG